VPGHQVVPQPVVTLRLKHGLKMTTSRRHEKIGFGLQTTGFGESGSGR
jgi:hypothetical protein